MITVFRSLYFISGEYFVTRIPLSYLVFFNINVGKGGFMFFSAYRVYSFAESEIYCTLCAAM